MFQGDLSGPPVSPDSQSSGPQREEVKVLLVGSRRGVETMIRTFYVRQLSTVREWSRLMPTDKPGEFMSILMRTFQVD